MPLITQKQLIAHHRSEPDTAGFILLDLSLRLIAFNSEAAMILGDSNPNTKVQVPEGLLKELRSRGHNGLSSLVTPLIMPFHTIRGDYICQAYRLNEPLPAGLPSSVILVLHRDTSVTETVSKVAHDFSLTERECEALIGISLGLSSKELAERMNISPNTVRTFLRLIMLKMGVSTRSALFARMLYARERSDL